MVLAWLLSFHLYLLHLALAMKLEINNGPVIVAQTHQPCMASGLSVLRQDGADIIERSVLEPITSTRRGDGSSISAIQTLKDCVFQQHHPDFMALFPRNNHQQQPVMTLELRQRSLDGTPFAHEGAVWLNETQEVLMTSNRLGDLTSSQQFVNIYAMDWTTGNVRAIVESTYETHNISPVPMANGAVETTNGNVMVCSQGRERTGGALVRLDPVTGAATTVLDNWHGLQFNSPNDVIVDRSGGMWFTDPAYGHEQHFRPPPQLGSWVWYVDKGTRASVMADGFVKPNGLAMDASESTLYVTDSGFFSGDGTWSTQRPRAIYAFDIRKENGRKPVLVNRRLFAVVDVGVPDGIKVDGDGRVYVGCGDGVHVFGSDGTLLGKIIVPGNNGVANLCFAGPQRDTLVMLSETAVYSVQLAVTSPK